MVVNLSTSFRVVNGDEKKVYSKHTESISNRDACSNLFTFLLFDRFKWHHGAMTLFRFSVDLDQTSPLSISIHTDQVGLIVPQLFFNESSKYI